ncbi:MAG: tetratricopeptide repeat protein, partial [candidate division Zixibacteria bacterium]|nr:tetratricopeptide repeat protein [candidate division Zixibacteria bacterium]
ARESYQTVSITAGVLFLGLAAAFSRMMFEQPGRRWLFFLGLSSGGYMLLFFGYVENYSLFVLSVVLFTLAGLMIARGRWNRWLILPPLLLAVFFHILGLTLIPGAIYLLLANTPLAHRLAKLKAGARLAGWLLLLAVAASILVYFYSNDYFFRFAFVPVTADRFTVEGYTMFSGKHLLDFLNLLLLLMPALPLFMLVLCSLPMKKIIRKAPYIFLTLLLVSTLGAVFVFDPKVGMPRDWDLFAFVGVPMVTGFFYVSLDDGGRLGRSPTVLLLAVLLGLVSVLPRAAAQASEEASISVVRDYMALDRVKNRYTGFVLARYYAETGDMLASSLETKRWQEAFPEREMVTLAKRLRAEAKTSEAITLLKRAIERNPHDSDAWSNLGEAYMTLRMYDSALYVCRIADGLNPNSAPILANLGSANYYLGHLDEAEKRLRKALMLDSTLFQIPYNLSHVHRDRGNMVKYLEYLEAAARIKGSNHIVFRELGDVYLRQRNYDRARRAYGIAVAKGLDSNYVRQREEKYPRLRND